MNVNAEAGGSNAGFNPAPPTIDLSGSPFAVLESDPGLFTTLTQKIGIKNLEVVEIYDIEPWAVDHIQPRGLFFCFLWRKDYHRPKDFKDPTAERVWFANQLIDDVCASQAILNVTLNCVDIDVGESLQRFREETIGMSPVMKGLAISNLTLIRDAHNSLARPADLKGGRNAIANATIDDLKPTTKPKASKKSQNNNEESYHFIGYVPAFGKVWELDGLKSGPLEVGELSDATSTSGWMNVVRPVIKQKMRKYGGAEDGENIRFNLLALVDDRYQISSDKLELLKREKKALERRLADVYPDGWSSKVDPAILTASTQSFSTAVQSEEPRRIFASNLGNVKMEREMEILDMPMRALVPAWENCVRSAMSAKVEVEDEIAKSVQQNTDHVKRTFDYEPFFREILTSLDSEGLLNPILGRDENGKKLPASRKAKGRVSKA